MKSLYFYIIVFFNCLTAFAYDVEVDGIYYGLIFNRAYVTYRDYENVGLGSYAGSIVIPEKITVDGKTYKVFSIGENAFSGSERLTHVSLPEGLTAVSGCAFLGCTSLQQVSLPSSLLAIGDCAFTGCTSLRQISLPRRAETVGQLTFYCCASLTSLILPHRIRTIETGALEHIPSVTDLWCFASEPPAADAKAFSLIDQRRQTLHVPSETLEQYRQAAVWCDFQDIVPITDSEYLAQGYKKGDVNDDGRVDSADLELMRRIIVHLPDDSSVRWAADVNGDGIVNAIDYVTLARQLR